MKTIQKSFAGIFVILCLLTARNVKAQSNPLNAVYVIAEENGSGQIIISPPFGASCSKMFFGKTKIMNQYNMKYSKIYGKTLTSVELKGPYSSWDEVDKDYKNDLKKLTGSKPYVFGLDCNMGKQ